MNFSLTKSSRGRFRGVTRTSAKTVLLLCDFRNEYDLQGPLDPALALLITCLILCAETSKKKRRRCKNMESKMARGPWSVGLVHVSTSRRRNEKIKTLMSGNRVAVLVQLRSMEGC